MMRGEAEEQYVAKPSARASKGVIYLVYIPSPGKVAREILERDFPDRYELHPGMLWVVSTPLPTSVSVCEALGLTSKRPTEALSRSSGLVVKFDDYYGMYDRGLWQAVDAWQSS